MSALFDFINIPLGYVIKFCYYLTHNYAIALLLFAIFVKLILFPLGIKQQKNMVKQSKLKPKEAAIRKKYAGRDDKVTQQKVNEEIMKLYQKENFNPAGGCLPLLIQFPILISLYQVVVNPLKYICNYSAEIIDQIQGKIYLLVNGAGLAADASLPMMSQIEIIKQMKGLGIEQFTDVVPNLTAEVLPNFTIFGGAIDLSAIPNFSSIDWLLLIPVLTFVVTFFSMKFTRKMTYQPDNAAAGGGAMKIMDFTMPLLSVWITFTVSAAIGLYWIYQNLFGVVQQIVLVKMYPLPNFTEEDYKAAEREMNVNIKQTKQKKKVRSLHRIDEDDGDDEDDSDEAKPAQLEASNSDATEEQLGPIKKAKLKDDNRNDK